MAMGAFSCREKFKMLRGCEICMEERWLGVCKVPAVERQAQQSPAV
jgi:hypothetical protein